MMLLGVLSVVYATGQDVYRVNRGSVNEYKIKKPATEMTYTWQVYTDAAFTAQAEASEVVLTPMGTGRENEIKVTWLTDGSYYLLVSVFDLKGCSNRMAWRFVVSQSNDLPIAHIAGAPIHTIGHCNDKGHVMDASNSKGNGLTYRWFPSTYLDDATSATPKYLGMTTTRYHLTVIDSKGQKDTTSVRVVVADKPKAVTDKNVFAGSANASILLDGSSSTGSGLAYLWWSKEGIILNGEIQSTAQVSGLGMYYLKVTDSWGCISVDSVNVGLYVQAINDTAQTNVNESVVINVVDNDLPQNTIDHTTISIVSPPSHGIATVAANSSVVYAPEELYAGQDEFIYSICDYLGNCDHANVLVLVNDLPLFIPEAFSPNGDGINDRLVIKGLEKYKTVGIEIYNRWGNIVFQSANYSGKNGDTGFWDGTVTSGMHTGSGPVPSGTYYYILKMNGNKNISGAIYLDR